MLFYLTVTCCGGVAVQGVVEGPCGGRSHPSEGARICHLFGPLRTLLVPEPSFALVPWTSPLPARTHMACASESEPAPFALGHHQANADGI